MTFPPTWAFDDDGHCIACGKSSEPLRFIVALCESVAREARERALMAAEHAARGEDANRGAPNEIAAAYIQGRLDACSDIRALAIPPKEAE